MISNSIYQSSKTLPYVYRLDNPITGEFYIGYREANKEPSHLDLPNYKTSAPYITPIFEEFNWTILAEFFDGESAFIFEQQLIKENFKVSGILNRRYYEKGTYKMFKLSGSKNGMFGKTQSPETITKMKANRISTKGKSYEDRYGLEKAKTLKETRSKSIKKIRENNPLTGSKNPRALKIEAISPEGKTYLIHGELGKFCKEHNLGASRVTDCYRHGKPHFKGWQFNLL